MKVLQAETESWITEVYEDQEFTDLKNFENIDKDFNVIYNYILDFIDSPIIEDSFEDHSERREWRTSMEEKHSVELIKSTLERNPLRINRIQNMVSQFNAVDIMMTYYVGDDKYEIDVINDELRPNIFTGKFWNDMPFEYKCIFIEEIKEKLQRIVDIFNK